MKVFKWFMKSLVICLILLFVFNVIGAYINLNIPINFWTILITFFLRLPGIIVLTIFFLL